ncbi:MAG: GumC family protein [Vicinamibacterales bacterium]
MFTEPVYRATATVLLSEDPAPSVGLGTGDDRRERPGLDPITQAEVVRSRTQARIVVESMKLWEEPRYAELLVGAGSDDERAHRLIDPFLSGLSATLVPESQVMRIAYESPDPELAARAANAVAEAFINRDRESRFSAASSSAEWLSERLREQREQVAKAEAALQTYRADNDALSLSDRQNIVGSKLNDLNSAVTRAKTERILKETNYRQIEAIQRDFAALETHPLVASSAYVQTLRAQTAELMRQDAQLADRLGPKHPDRVQVMSALTTVQERLRTEVAKVVDGIRAEFNAAAAQEASLTRALEQQKTEALTLDRKNVDYAALEREAVSARQIYDALLQQTKEASLTTGVQRSSVRLVDGAEVPGEPIRPKKGQGYAAAVLLGVVGALGAAYGREYMRRKIASPADVESRLGLPLLALVPPAAAEEANRIGGLSPLVAEAFRKLRAGIMLASGDADAPGNVIVVTSAAPSEGKSFVSAHLAAAFAATDQRVLLIDADLRRPRLHETFDRKRAPGLTDVLLNRRSAAEVLRPVSVQGLSLIPAGLPTAKASDLTAVAGFQQLIESLRPDFDWIVVDSPPVMAVADASLMARDATGVLFVTTADQTSLEAADAALNDLDAGGARMFGAVLNRAPLSREAFYYSRYYRPEYASYLTTEEGVPAEVSATAP